MSDKLTLESVKAEAVAENGRYSDNTRLDARKAWWVYCEANQKTHLPTFREFWNDEVTYPFVK